MLVVICINLHIEVAIAIPLEVHSIMKKQWNSPF